MIRWDAHDLLLKCLLTPEQKTIYCILIFEVIHDCFQNDKLLQNYNSIIFMER